MSNILYIDPDTNRNWGLLNKLKRLIHILDQQILYAGTNYGDNLPQLARRYGDVPQLVGSAYNDLYSMYNDPYTSSFRWVSTLAKQTVSYVVSVAKELNFSDYRSALIALALDMQQTNHTFQRVNYTITTTPSPSNLGVANVLLTPLVPITWGNVGLVDPFDSVAKPVEVSPLVYYETLDIQAVSSENDERPAVFQVLGDVARTHDSDFAWVEGGSGTDVTVNMYLPTANTNYVPNGSFEEISLSSGPTGWSFYDLGSTWGVGSLVYYSQSVRSHGTQSLQINNVVPSDKGFYANLAVSFEPYKVYFLLFDAYATATMPAGARLHVRFKDSSGAISHTQLPVGFYNSAVSFSFGSGTNQIPHNATSFGTVWVPLVTDHRVVQERRYRIEFTLTLGTGETWPTGGLVYLDRVVLVPGQQLYKLGPYIAVIGGKNNPVRLGDRWEIDINRQGLPNQYEYWSWWTNLLLGCRDNDIFLPVSDTPIGSVS